MLKARLLASALAPVGLIVALRISADYMWWSIGLAVISLASITSLVSLLRARSSLAPEPYELTVMRDESPQVAAYLLTYLFPLASLSPRSWREVAAYLLFLGLLAILVVRTDLLLTNPILLAFGCHLYAVETTTGWQGLLLSFDRPKVGQTIHAVHITPTALRLVHQDS